MIFASICFPLRNPPKPLPPWKRRHPRQMKTHRMRSPRSLHPYLAKMKEERNGWSKLGAVRHPEKEAIVGKGTRKTKNEENITLIENQNERTLRTVEIRDKSILRIPTAVRTEIGRRVEGETGDEGKKIETTPGIVAFRATVRLVENSWLPDSCFFSDEKRLVYFIKAVICATSHRIKRRKSNSFQRATGAGRK